MPVSVHSLSLEIVRTSVRRRIHEDDRIPMSNMSMYSQFDLKDFPIPLQKMIFHFGPRSDNCWLTSYIQNEGCQAKIPYDYLSFEFNRAFFARNLIKCFLFCSSFRNFINPHYFVDIGAGSTNWIVFQQGAPHDSGLVPVGGEHFTQDIAIGLST
ncbi:MAG: hypothetical protein HYS63_09610, partial [Methylocystis sp.]|nr:hypothetical protein [Methylocystis sp.]